MIPKGFFVFFFVAKYSLDGKVIPVAIPSISVAATSAAFQASESPPIAIYIIPNREVTSLPLDSKGKI